MDTINELSIRNALTQSPKQPGGPRRTIGEDERNLINQFFARLRVIYGAKYGQAFPNEDSVRYAKREWAQQIVAYSADELHIKLERLKNGLINHEPYCWPNLGSVLAIPLRDTVSPTGVNAAAYLPAPDLPKLTSPKERRQAAGEAAIKALRDMLADASRTA